MRRGVAWLIGCVLCAGVGVCRAQRLEPPAVAPGVRTSEVPASVEQFLRRFEQASEANDADRKSELYAEVVDRYFLRTHVTREFVYNDVLDWLRAGRLITRFRLTVLSVSGTGEERTLLVRKEASWIAGSDRKELVVRSQLVLRRAGAGWLIVGERDFA